MGRDVRPATVFSGCSVNTNRFDCLRLVFATCVCVYHIIALAALNVGGPWERGLATLAELSIQGFFIISGALVLGSLQRSEGIGNYAERRLRRLYPAYALIILVPALASLPAAGNPAASIHYVLPNLVFLNFIQPTLPGLFEDNRFMAVNGALWTLKIEVMFYMALPVLFWIINRFGKNYHVFLAILIIGAELWRWFFTGGPGAQIFDTYYGSHIARQLPGQMGFFACGMILRLMWDKAKQPRILWLMTGAACVALCFAFPFMHILKAPGLTLIIAWIAFVEGPALNAARFGDMSYGVYITHFPIIQTLVAAGVFALDPALGIISALAVTFAAAFVLWNSVEKPFLHRTS
ncbi:MAG: acyltransferase, partial [Hyphomonadaceae bacterium]|nr:acyltransferase [Hyphomonadaceae bacterium]